jgi:uncharacterized membrane protein YphA (DoxX/SURF4 family)
MPPSATLPIDTPWLVRIVLRVTVAMQCLGLARMTWLYGTPIFSLLWGEPDLGGWGWSEAAALQVENIAAWCLCGAALIVLVRPNWLVLLLVSIWFTLVAAAGTWVGGEMLSELSLPEQATRILAPMCLAMIDPWRVLPKVEPKRWRTSWVTLARIAVAVTFAAHGWKALCLSPTFVDYILAASQDLAGYAMSQTTAEEILWAIGVIDMIVAVLILGFRSPWIAGYMACWGFVTAASRIVYAGWAADYEFLIRAANFGLPLALAVYWSLSWKHTRWSDQEEQP